MSTNKKRIIGIVAFVFVIAAMLTAFFVFRDKPVKGSKSIVISVIDADAKTTVYELKTDASFLKQAMEETKGLTFSGTESQYGTMIDTVNGIRADYNKDKAYWSFYVNDEYCANGIETQVVNDGDKFKIVYTKAE